MHMIEDILARAPVIPVLTVTREADAVPLARALVAGGLPVLEVTLRTPVALAAIAAMAAEVPGAVIGAGTVLTPDDAAAAERAGAAFLVSPGASETLLAALKDRPWLPGVATASEAMRAREVGFRHLKFFPAEAAGGRAALAALAAPLADLRFCPTGGIHAGNAAEYLALESVACVGGSWVAPKAAQEAGDWAAVEALAREARILGQDVR